MNTQIMNRTKCLYYHMNNINRNKDKNNNSKIQLNKFRGSNQNFSIQNPWRFTFGHRILKNIEGSLACVQVLPQFYLLYCRNSHKIEFRHWNAPDQTYAK